MGTLIGAIESRRSIRRFRPEDVSEQVIMELIRAAQLAPSGCNAQPWRFKVVKDAETKQKLIRAAHNQSFIAEAPVVIICCGDIKGYLDDTVSGLQDLLEIGAVNQGVADVINGNVKRWTRDDCESIKAKIAVNVAIAVEHIALRAVDFGMGTCWVRLFDEEAVRNIFGWDNNITVVAILPTGYPAESPAPRKRMPIEDLLL